MNSNLSENLKLKRGIKVISLLGMLILFNWALWSTLTGSFWPFEDTQDDSVDISNWDTPQETIAQNVSGVILPHHLLVEGFIDKFYDQLAESNDYDRIIIMSPNHFGEGQTFLQTKMKIEGDVKLDQEFIEYLLAETAVGPGNNDFAMEHGLFAHYPFLHQYFPEAKMVPIIVKTDTPCTLLDTLSEQIVAVVKDNERTLFLASLDFTHYSGEEVARKNDTKTIEWLSDSARKTPTAICQQTKMIALGFDQENTEAVGVDSPETLSLMRMIMQKSATDKYTFWLRSSSNSLLKGSKDTDNTSHIFGYFN